MMNRFFLGRFLLWIGLVFLTAGAAHSAQFTVNPNRFDPYKQFKFRVKWDGRYVAGITKVSGFHRETEVIANREGTEHHAEVARKDHLQPDHPGERTDP
jgi:hypothetical protein